MNVTLSLNEGARTSYRDNVSGENGYVGSIFLATEFANHGHDLSVVHPQDLFQVEKDVCAQRVYGFTPENGFVEAKNSSRKVESDVFFVYGLGEDQDGVEVPKRFMNLLYGLEGQCGLVLNSADSTSYEFKGSRKGIEDYPWIPNYSIGSKRDITDLLESGIDLIAKPKLGILGRGVEFLSRGQPIPSEIASGYDSYIFEKFVPANEERRYIFLDGNLILRRRIERTGSPGKEVYANVDLMGGIESEERIARELIFKIGMFYGAIDFRGDYLLEINGSGTGVAPPTIEGNQDAYNLSSPIVQAVERKVGEV